jgi:serine/threonine protein kinase
MNILMEYVPGSSLDAILQKFGALDEQVIRTYTRQLLEALNYCHGNRIIHRDIKGKNILVDTHGTLKLADFGSAKQFVEAKAAPSLNYNYTPLWTAPEVLIGDYTYKIDIWSLGCVIIEMATAKQPWDEENFENPFRALYHIGLAPARQRDARLPASAHCSANREL